MSDDKSVTRNEELLFGEADAINSLRSLIPILSTTFNSNLSSFTTLQAIEWRSRLPTDLPSFFKESVNLSIRDRLLPFTRTYNK